MSWKRIVLVVVVVFLVVSTVGAEPCGPWQRLAPFPAPIGLNGVAGGVSRIVAVGDRGTVLAPATRWQWSRSRRPVGDRIGQPQRACAQHGGVL